MWVIVVVGGGLGCRRGEVLGFGVQVSRWDGEISMGGGDLTGGR
jgi:hypothetical protein